MPIDQSGGKTSLFPNDSNLCLVDKHTNTNKDVLQPPSTSNFWSTEINQTPMSGRINTTLKYHVSIVSEIQK